MSSSTWHCRILKHWQGFQSSVFSFIIDLCSHLFSSGGDWLHLYQQWAVQPKWRTVRLSWAMAERVRWAPLGSQICLFPLATALSTSGSYWLDKQGLCQGSGSVTGRCSERFVPLGHSLAASLLRMCMQACTLPSAAFSSARQMGISGNQEAWLLFVAVFWKALLSIKMHVRFFCHFTGFLN